MSIQRRLVSLTCKILSILFIISGLPVQAMAWERPSLMAWATFEALYQAAGETGGTVTLIGNLELREGEYTIGATPQPVVINTAGYSIWISSGGILTIDAPDLTIFADLPGDGMGTLLLSGGELYLNNCKIRTVNSPALTVSAVGSAFHMENTGRVEVEVNYLLPQEDLPLRCRNGICYGSLQEEPLILHNLELTMLGGDAAIYTSSNVELYNCTIDMQSNPSIPVAIFSIEGRTLTKDIFTKIIPDLVENPDVEPSPEPSATPEPSPEPSTSPEPSPEPSPTPGGDSGIIPGLPNEVYPVSGFYSEPYTDLKLEIECLSGTDPTSLSLSSTTMVQYVTEDYYNGLEGVPIQWDLSGLPSPLCAGTYWIYGKFSDTYLAEHNIVNPKQIGPAVEMRVYDPGPYQDLEVGIVANDDYRVVVYQNLPKLTGAEAIYAEFSTDNVNWFRAHVATTSLWEGKIEYSENLMDGIEYLEDFIKVKIKIGPAFYTRLVIVGTPFEGTTNIAEIAVLEVPNNGGDHGGGGQGEHDRPGKQEKPEEEKPEPVEQDTGDMITLHELWKRLAGKVLVVLPNGGIVPIQEPIPTAAPEELQEPVPEQLPSVVEVPATATSMPQQEEASVVLPVQEERISELSTEYGDTEQTVVSTQVEPEVPSEPIPSQASELPEETAPTAIPDEPIENSESVSIPLAALEPAASSLHIPGFVTATVATTVLIGLGAAYFYWHRKKK